MEAGVNGNKLANVTSESIEETLGVKDKDLQKLLLDARDALCRRLKTAKLPVTEVSSTLNPNDQAGKLSA